MTKARRKPRSPWDMIDPQNRPTAERMRYGDVVPVEFAEKGEGRLKGVVAFDRAANPVALAHGRKKLSTRQRDAAQRLEEIAHVLSINGGSRDSLDLSPRGSGDISDHAAIRQANARSEWSRARRCVNAVQWEYAVQIVVEHKPFKSYAGRRFKECAAALEAMADLWKIA